MSSRNSSPREPRGRRRGGDFQAPPRIRTGLLNSRGLSTTSFPDWRPTGLGDLGAGFAFEGRYLRARPWTLAGARNTPPRRGMAHREDLKEPRRTREGQVRVVQLRHRTRECVPLAGEFEGEPIRAVLPQRENACSSGPIAEEMIAVMSMMTGSPARSEIPSRFNGPTASGSADRRIPSVTNDVAASPPRPTIGSRCF